MLSIKVPPLGESIVEATVSRWLKKEGDAVASGDTLVELETDKITVEVPALKAGVLTKRAAAEGDVVKVDDVLGEIDETATAAATVAGAAQAPAAAAQGAKGAQGGTATATAAPAQAPAQPAAQAGNGAQRVSPAAERAAAERGVDTGAIQGTGRGGVVSKPDVIEQSRGGAPARTPSVAASAAPSATPSSGGGPAGGAPAGGMRPVAEIQFAD